MIYALFMPNACQSVLKNQTVALKCTVDIATNVTFQAFLCFAFKEEAHIRQTRDIPEIVLCMYQYGAFLRV